MKISHLLVLCYPCHIAFAFNCLWFKSLSAFSSQNLIVFLTLVHLSVSFVLLLAKINWLTDWLTDWLTCLVWYPYIFCRWRYAFYLSRDLTCHYIEVSCKFMGESSWWYITSLTGLVTMGILIVERKN